MDNLSIYKFVAEKTNQTAFVIASFPSEAAEILLEETVLKFYLDANKEIGDFTKASEYFDDNGKGVWINNIDPF